MSNAALQILDDAADEAFLAAGMADAALYVPAGGGRQVTCTVMLTRSMQDFGYESRVANPMITIRARVAEVGTPARGATFLVGTEQFVVDGAPLDADESAVLLQCKKVAP